MSFKEYRLRAGLTQKELADKLGVSKSHISEIENHKAFLSVELLFHLASILRVKPCILLGYDCNLFTNDTI